MSRLRVSGQSRRLWMAPMVVVTVLLAACGGGGGGSASSAIASDVASDPQANKPPKIGRVLTDIRNIAYIDGESIDI